MNTWDTMSDVDQQHMQDAGRDEGGRHLGDRVVDVRPWTCEYEMELWGPHDGCREYMTEPEAIVTCDAPATRRYRLRFYYGPGLSEDQTVYACEAHTITEEPYMEVLSEETLTTEVKR